MPVRIPVRPGLTYFTTEITLDGANYALLLRWNLREEAWYMDVLDEPQTTVLVGGLKLVADYPLGIPRTGRMPPGLFVALDTTGEGIDPGIDDLGDRVKLLYYSADEL